MNNYHIVLIFLNGNGKPAKLNILKTGMTGAMYLEPVKSIR